MNKTIQEGLKQFQDNLSPNEFSMEQAEKLHFYAGAAWVLAILSSMDNMTPAAAVGVMQGLQDEVDIFYDTDEGSTIQRTGDACNG